MSNQPANSAGLSNYKRVMITRFGGTCEWCGAGTSAHTNDFAALGHDGKWIASCIVCSVSVSAMIHGVCTRIAAVQDTLSAEQLATLSMPSDLAEALSGTLSAQDTLMCLVNTVAVWKAVEAFTRVEDARIIALRHITPKPGFESSFIPSVLAAYADKGDLSPKQWGCVDKALAARAKDEPNADGTPKPRTGRPNRYSGKCVNCSFQVPAGHGVYSNGAVSHTVCPTFEEWCVDTYGALPGSDELRQIAVDHGQSTSHCIFCGLTLDHPDSDPRQGGVGYGPVCAGKYGLPHGGSGKRS
jgi:hypothetical protein